MSTSAIFRSIEACPTHWLHGLTRKGRWLHLAKGRKALARRRKLIARGVITAFDGSPWDHAAMARKVARFKRFEKRWSRGVCFHAGEWLVSPCHKCRRALAAQAANAVAWRAERVSAADFVDA